MQLKYCREMMWRTGRGWYWTRPSDFFTSQAFATEEQAIAAQQAGQLYWS